MKEDVLIKLLNREKHINFMSEKIIEIENNINNPKQIRGFFIYGKNSIGKTSLVNYFIKQNNLCKINFDGFDNRNKNNIENIQKINVSNHSIISLFQKKPKKNIIVMDDIEIMNVGDKGGINTLVKMLRPKKTKKQLQEIHTKHIFICICDEKHDKKLNELKKACYDIHIQKPNTLQITNILKKHNILLNNIDENNKNNIFKFINGNLDKLFEFIELYNWDSTKVFDIIKNNLKQTEKVVIKELTKDIYLNKYSIEDYSLKINETDKTSLSLLLHENLSIIMNFVQMNNKKFSIECIEKYNDVLNKYSFIDYYDRIIFQKQIWILNDLTALLKVKYINNFIQDSIRNYIDKYSNFYTFINKSNIIFTKVLTKYTSEYNNKLFLNNLSHIFNVDNKDIIFIFLQFFYSYKKYHNENKNINIEKNIDNIISKIHYNNFNLNKLDIKRIYKFIDYIYYI